MPNKYTKTKTCILIIGNGFDRQCGLKSSFSDFHESQYWIDEKYIGYKNFHITSCWFSIFTEIISQNNEFQNWNWSNIEQVMEVILNDFENTISTDLKENIKNHITLDHFKSIKDQISDFLLNGLKKYEDRFIDYLNYIISESEENQLKQNPNFKKYSWMVRNLLEKISIASNIEKQDMLYIINFNYTRITKSVLSEGVTEINSVTDKTDNSIRWGEGWIRENNVHGTLDKKNIIVGIDDKSCNENTGMFKFSKTYRKMKIRSEINNELPANIDQLIFYGHSLGKQDYSYFHSIFDFYNIYNSSIKLLFCYAKGYENQTFDSIYHLIHEYGNEFTNQKQGHNLLHKILLEGRLQIIEIPSIDSIK